MRVCDSCDRPLGHVIRLGARFCSDKCRNDSKNAERLGAVRRIRAALRVLDTEGSTRDDIREALTS
ncbi:hypothetical protein LQK93_03609 [Terrabacter sp. BE26]